MENKDKILKLEKDIERLERAGVEYLQVMERDKHSLFTRILPISLLISGIIIFGVFTMVRLTKTNIRAEVNIPSLNTTAKIRDTETEEIEKLVGQVLKVYTMTDKETYNQVRKETKDLMTNEVIKQYFPLQEWTIANRNRLTLTVDTVDIGLLQDNKREVLVKFNILGQGFNKDYISLLEITSNNKVSKIERIH